VRTLSILALATLVAAIPARATVFSTLRGIVHDPQHRPIADATVSVQSLNSAFALSAATGPEGAFTFANVPIGSYRLSVEASGFASSTQTITLISGSNPILHIPLSIAAASASIIVTASSADVAEDTVTPTTLIDREQIETTPGADRTTGMEMITDFVPGAYMTHDMLHMRGGHQTSWLIDGVDIPNTKIASNLGPQIDPKDIDQLETQRGSYSSSIGDRTYGVFDVLPRNGWEFNHEAELTVELGNPNMAESQLALGDHSTRTAWYASATGSRSNYGLATPVPQILHDATNSESGLISLIRNQTPNDQLRFDAQYRQDHFQIPYDPNPNDWEQASQYYESWGLRDVQSERDSFVIANWIHTFSPRATLAFAPFYHINQANYDSPPADLPAATTWHQLSNYVGGQSDAHVLVGPNTFSTGAYTFYQAENDIFGVQVNDGSAPSEPNTASNAGAALFEYYVSDSLRVGRYVTLVGGERFSVYRAGIDESAVYPRVGATFLVPHLNWVLRGFYGHFFQPAPLETVSTSVLEYASHVSGENAFTPLPSERDEEHQFGITIPYRGWALDVDNFATRVNNFLDHSSLGESNMFFPIAVDGALIRGWEMTLRSPTVARFGQFHLAYSNQIAEQRGNIIGGFTCSVPTDPACDLGPGYFPVDHDQRDTLNAGFQANLPAHTWFASNVYYGSGFTNGLAGAGVGPFNGPHLPAHTTFDSAVGHNLGDNLHLSVNAVNVTNHRVLLDNSVTVGGFHWNDPRMFYGELRYRFRF
jgi:hypothetical protein